MIRKCGGKMGISLETGEGSVNSYHADTFEEQRR